MAVIVAVPSPTPYTSIDAYPLSSIATPFVFDTIATVESLDTNDIDDVVSAGATITPSFILAPIATSAVSLAEALNSDSAGVPGSTSELVNSTLSSVKVIVMEVGPSTAVQVRTGFQPPTRSMV